MSKPVNDLQVRKLPRDALPLGIDRSERVREHVGVPPDGLWRTAGPRGYRHRGLHERFGVEGIGGRDLANLRRSRRCGLSRSHHNEPQMMSVGIDRRGVQRHPFEA